MRAAAASTASIVPLDYEERCDANELHGAPHAHMCSPQCNRRLAHKQCSWLANVKSHDKDPVAMVALVRSGDEMGDRRPCKQFPKRPAMEPMAGVFKLRAGNSTR
jgi:hypothetical protein